MRKLLNTLYVTAADAYLARDGENIVVKVKGEEKARFPVHNMEGIVSLGYSGASPALMALCCERHVPITFLSEHGSFLARVTGRVSGNVLLRREQYRTADSATFRATMARSFLTGKLMNCRAVLLRFARDHGAVPQVGAAASALLALCQALQHKESVEEIRGIEGEAAREYYTAFNHLTVNQSEQFSMRGRNRRPPLDRMNSLLSFLYTLLATECANALETVGLDPQVGYLHADRSGRLGLALDLMEELRPHLADRLALSLVNNRQVSADGFDVKETGAVLMDSNTRKTVLSAWQKRKQDEINHPYLGERIGIGLIAYTQALLLARHLRGDLDGYPPFVFR